MRGISAWVSGSKPAEEALPTAGQPRMGWQNPKGVRRASPWVVAGCRTSNPTWGEAGADMGVEAGSDTMLGSAFHLSTL